MEKNEKQAQEKKSNDKNEPAKLIDILNALKELARLQAITAKLTAQITIKEGKDNIQSAVDAKKNYLESQAKKLGVKLKESGDLYGEINDSKNGILATYKKALEKINEHYNALLLEITEKKSNLEQEEQNIIIQQGKNKEDEKKVQKDINRQMQQLKTDIAQALKNSDADTLVEKSEALQKLMNTPNYFSEKSKDLEKQRHDIQEAIQACDEQYKKIMAEKVAKMNEIINSKDNGLIDLPKQNIFSKFIGSIYNKFNGVKKFRQNVLRKEAENNKRISEEIVSQLEKGDSQSDSSNKKNGMKDHIFQNIRNVQASFKSIIDRAYQAKVSALNKAQSALDEKLSNQNKKIKSAQQKLANPETEKKDEQVGPEQ